MFWPDIGCYRQFYQSLHGQLACRRLRQVITRCWPDVRHDTIAGIGYTIPYLLALQDKAQQVIACMPAQQGARLWPVGQPCKTILTYEDALPFPDHSLERVLVVHALEHTQFALPMLEDIWRVLVPGGTLLVVVPNRRGIWAHMDNTPLGSGHPYSRPQLARLLQQARFSAVLEGSLLHFPPTEKRMWLRLSGLLDKLGAWLCPAFGGWLWMEAEKQLYATSKQPVKRFAPGWGHPERLPAGVNPRGKTL